VDGAGDALFARAALARDEDRARVLAMRCDELQDAPHRLGVAEDLPPGSRASCARRRSFSATMARFSSALWTSARSSVVANGLVTKS
jgi:hypothetical protein